MKTKYRLLFALIFILAFGCDKDKFADLNTNPSTLSEPDLRYSVTSAIEQIYRDFYTIWFYNNAQYDFPWSQVETKSGGNGTTFNEMGPYASQDIYAALIPQTVDVRTRIDAASDEEKSSYQALRAMTYPIQIAAAITVTDQTGSMIYSEAGLAPYTNPPLLTPVFDSQSTLFTTWLSELDQAIAGLSTDDQFEIGTQDVIYNGDYSKWAKYCNLLKLKIAARLVNKDRNKAISIAEEVVNSSAGYMNALDDDFIYRRANDFYGTENSIPVGHASKNLVDFLRTNHDPRLRFIFEKNDFNAEVVQAFIDAEKALPPYVEANVEYNTEGNFAGWKGDGEPWVRYYGAPVSPDETTDADNDIYFNQSILNKLATKTYASTSVYSEKLIRTCYDFTYPTKPGGRVLELKDNDPPCFVILGTAAETNLYLAEFKLLGANLPQSAQDYLNQGVRLSVERADKFAEHQQMPYYESDPVYTDEVESETAATKLRAGEIDALLQQDICDLSTDGLEKVYIQQYINFINTPYDVWTTVRRSGCPKKNSSYLPWEDFTVSGAEMVIPRRYYVSTPTEDDLNYENQKSAMSDQGFTTGTMNPGTLNSERLWFDQENPTYGAGPKN